MDTEEHSVSVVMPIRNGARFFEKMRKNVESVLRTNDELIIIDDHSTDSTYELSECWKKSDQRVSVHKNKSRGLVSALNLGVSMSKFEWIARMDVDDTYHPNRLNSQLARVTNDIVIVFSDYRFVSSGDKNLGMIETAITPKFTALSLVSSTRTPHSSALFRKSVFHEAGRYVEKDFLAEDLSLWLRMSRLGKIVSVPNVLLNYTISGTGISQRKRSATIQARDRVLRLLRFDKRLLEEDTEDWFNELSELRESPGPTVREMLLLRDLVKYQSIYGSEILFRTLAREILLNSRFSLTSWKSFMRHSAWKGIRSVYRTSSMRE